MRFQLAFVCATYAFIFLTHRSDADDVIIQKRIKQLKKGSCILDVEFSSVKPQSYGEEPNVYCQWTTEETKVSDSDLAAMFDPRHKKPFCNAFTGCGRKRSDESLATLVDLNSEPAVEELSRQILSEAKLWEAIQEARVELLRRRSAQQQQPIDKIPQKPFSLASLKKRSVDYLDS